MISFHLREWRAGDHMIMPYTPGYENHVCILAGRLDAWMEYLDGTDEELTLERGMWIMEPYALHARTRVVTLEATYGEYPDVDAGPNSVLVLRTHLGPKGPTF